MSHLPNNLTQPYIANEIGNYFDNNTNETARLLAHAFEEQATGKWDTIGIATDVVTNTTTISNNPFTEFVLDESIGNAVYGARGK